MAPSEAVRDADGWLDSPRNSLNLPCVMPTFGFFGALFRALTRHIPAGKAWEILGA